MKKLMLILALTFSFAAHCDDVVDFFIVKGTGNNPWNTADTMVKAKVGQTLRFHNEDEIGHQLHTNGSPCAHGPLIASGQTWDCVLKSTYTKAANGALYEHNVGPKAAFFLEVTNE